MHEPRGKVGVGIGYAVAEQGADHLNTVHDTMLVNPASIAFKGAQALGIDKALPARDLSSDKVRQYFTFESWLNVEKAIGICFFGPAPRSFIQVQDVVDAVRAATGWDIDLDYLLEVGERTVNMARVFNAREGFSRKEDTLPERLFQPLEGGALEGVAISRQEFENALTDLYNLKGWNVETAAPTRQRLEALGLGWATRWLPEA